MTWKVFLPPADKVSLGLAIIDKSGVHCCHQGSWNATSSEEVHFSNILKMPSAYIGKCIMYNREKYIIVRASDEMVYAVKPHEGIMFKQSKTVFVCAHLSTENNLYFGPVSKKIDNVITTLLEKSL